MDIYDLECVDRYLRMVSGNPALLHSSEEALLYPSPMDPMRDLKGGVPYGNGKAQASVEQTISNEALDTDWMAQTNQSLREQTTRFGRIHGHLQDTLDRLMRTRDAIAESVGRKRADQCLMATIDGITKWKDQVATDLCFWGSLLALRLQLVYPAEDDGTGPTWVEGPFFPSDWTQWSISEMEDHLCSKGTRGNQLAGAMDHLDKAKEVIEPCVNGSRVHFHVEEARSTIDGWMERHRAESRLLCYLIDIKRQIVSAKCLQDTNDEEEHEHDLLMEEAADSESYANGECPRPLD